MRQILALGFVGLVGAGLAWSAGLWQAAPAPVTLTDATARADAAGFVDIYLTMEAGRTPNRLVGVRAPDAGEAVFVGEGLRAPLALPAMSRPSLAADGVHIRLAGVDGPLDEGRLLPVALTFEPAGEATALARIGAPADPHAGHIMPAPEGPVPALAVSVAPEDAQWRVTIETAGFTFAPAPEPAVHVVGEGHGHLYLNGLKIQRVYEPEVVIGALPPGDYVLSVTLNTHAHAPYRDAEGPVSASATFVVE